MLEGKTILIMGAGGLLGSKLTQECLSQKAKVIAADTNIEQARQRLKGLGVSESCQYLQFQEIDITDEQQMINFFSSLTHIDGAVNATYPRNNQYGNHFFDVNLKSFNENVSLHLGSSFLFTQQCAAYFKSKLHPLSVVNISSIYGVIAPKFSIYENTSMTMPIEYAAIKSALLHLNKYITAYINDSRFRVNAVSPGGIFDHQPEKFCDSYKKLTNGAGMLDVSEIIGAIVFLLSESSRYITAQNIIVDDGFTL